MTRKIKLRLSRLLFWFCLGFLQVTECYISTQPFLRFLNKPAHRRTSRVVFNYHPNRYSDPYDDMDDTDGWLPVTADGGVMKRIVSKGTDFTLPRPRKGALCNIDMNMSVCVGNETSFFGSMERHVMDIIGKHEFSWDNPVHARTGIRGYYFAFPTMWVGEVAEFRFSPEYAYGENGVPEHNIPSNATIQLGVRLNFCQIYDSESILDSESQEQMWDDQLNADPLMKQSTITRLKAEQAKKRAQEAGDAEIVSEQTERRSPPIIDTTTGSPVDWGKYSEAELRQKLESCGLPTHGRRELLVKRLQAFIPSFDELEEPEHVRRERARRGPESSIRDDVQLDSQGRYVIGAQYEKDETRRRKEAQKEAAGQSHMKAPGMTRPRQQKNVRMLDEEPQLNEDPDTHIQGREENAISYSETVDNESDDARAVVCWDEKRTNIDVFVLFDPLSELGRELCTTDLQVTIKPRRLKVELLLANGNTVTLAAGELVNSIDSEASFWWIEESDTLDQWKSSGLLNNTDVKEGLNLTADNAALVKIALKKRPPGGIWSGVWKYELRMANSEHQDGAPLELDTTTS